MKMLGEAVQLGLNKKDYGSSGDSPQTSKTTNTKRKREEEKVVVEQDTTESPDSPSAKRARPAVKEIIIESAT
jgi:hypothetical protein